MAPEVFPRLPPRNAGRRSTLLRFPDFSFVFLFARGRHTRVCASSRVKPAKGVTQSAFKAAENAACREVNGLARCAKLKFALDHDGALGKFFFGRLNLKLIMRERREIIFTIMHLILYLINLILFFITSQF